MQSLLKKIESGYVPYQNTLDKYEITDIVGRVRKKRESATRSCPGSTQEGRMKDTSVSTNAKVS